MIEHMSIQTASRELQFQHHNDSHLMFSVHSSAWSERDRTPTLLMSLESCTCMPVCAYVRPSALYSLVEPRLLAKRDVTTARGMFAYVIINQKHVGELFAGSGRFELYSPLNVVGRPGWIIQKTL